MGKIIIHNEKITDESAVISSCPFGAIEKGKDGKLETNAACRLCKLCIKKAKNGEIEYTEEKKNEIDRSLWRGICVYVEHSEGDIHPVTFELIGKARELADKTGQKVYCLMIGDGIEKSAHKLLHYPVDRVYLYEHKLLRDYRCEPYAAVLEDYANAVHPCAILVGATPVGRQMAPRAAARFHTGLTADCTVLDMEPNTDLVQIRPAFGGNIMAQIATPNHRPQMATVRYKVMQGIPESEKELGGVIEKMSISEDKLKSGIKILSIKKKEKVKTIEAADAIVVAGKGVRSKEDLSLVKRLADCLGAELACTRPLVESGWVEARRQVGLSGRTVRPKLIITCGVSGAVQFAAGMKGAETIIAINRDPDAPIFQFAHYGLVGDLYEIIPKLISDIEQSKEVKR